MKLFLIRVWHWAAGHGQHLEAGPFNARCRPCEFAYRATIKGALVRLKCGTLASNTILWEIPP